MRPRPSRAVRALLAAAALAAALIASAGCPRGVPAAPTVPTLDDAQRQQYLESFDYVWTTIRDKNWDPDLGGVDWNGIRDELRPKMAEITTRREARAILSDLVSRLGLTHFGIVAGDAADEVEEGGHESRREAGLDVRVIDGQALVTAVDSASDAAQQGVRPGWVIAKLGDVEVAPRMEKLAETYADSTLLAYQQAGAVFARLDGPAGTSCEVTFVDGNGKDHALEIERGEPRGEPVTFGNMPTVYVAAETRALAGGRIGYMAFNYWMDPARILKMFEDLVKESADRDGIVIDIRGNPGGIGGMSMGFAGWLIADKGSELGKMYTRDATLRFYVNPRRGAFGGPVAVLVDGLSASTSEIFAGGMKDLGRARVFGSRTAGAALPSVIERLPTGEIFQYAIADYISTGGEHLEGVGVEPHETIVPTREHLLEGRDPVLERAVAWIQEQP